MVEDQNVEIAVEWTKYFLCQKDTAETRFSSGKLRAIFKNLAGFVVIDEVPSYLLWVKSIKEEDLESTNKNYHPRHHNTMAPICLHERKKKKKKKTRENSGE